METQYSWLGNPMDKEVWQATVHGVTRVGQDLWTKQQSVFQTLKYLGMKSHDI